MVEMSLVVMLEVKNHAPNHQGESARQIPPQKNLWVRRVHQDPRLFPAPSTIFITSRTTTTPIPNPRAPIARHWTAQMSRCQSVARPLVRQLASRPQQCLARPFTSTTAKPADVKEQQPSAAAQPSPLDLDPDTVLPEFEAQLIKAGKMPVGSRRRRLALRSVPEPLPFEQLPYQAFQEARKILAADREDKLQKIRTELAKIAWLEEKSADDVKGGQYMKDVKLASLRRHVEELKILADVNDPVVKKRFEDGLGELLFDSR